MERTKLYKRETIDLILGYFENELSRFQKDRNESKDSNRFSVTFVLSSMVMTFSGISILLNKLFEFGKSDLSFYILIIFFVLLMVVQIMYLIIDNSIKKESIEQETCCEEIIHYLLHLRIIKSYVDISPLVEKIKQDYRTKTPDKIKEYRKYEIKRLKEYLEIIDQINSKLIKDELALKRMVLS